MKKLLSVILVSLLLTSCGSGQWVAKVDNISITSGEYQFYLSSIKEQLSGTELQTEEDWQTQEIEGEKAIEVAKKRALDIATQNAEYIVLAKKAGLTLTSDDKKQVEETKKQIISRYGGEKAYKEFLKENQITDSFIRMMCESPVYYKKILDKLEAENSITDESLRDYFDNNKNVIDAKYRKAKHILFLTMNPETGEEFSSEVQENKKDLAEEVLARIESGEDFDTLMWEFSEDTGLETNSDGYVFGSGEMVPEFEQATDSIGIGEITLCKSSYGYHIIKRLPITFEEVSDKLTSVVVDQMVSEQIKVWEKEFGLEIKTNEKVYKDIK